VCPVGIDIHDGPPGTPRRSIRPAVVALGAASAASLALLVGAAHGREPLEVNVTSASNFAPRRTADGRVHNAYSVAFENRGRAPLTPRREGTRRCAPRELCRSPCPRRRPSIEPGRGEGACRSIQSGPSVAKLLEKAGLADMSDAGGLADMPR
jgi:polyferredoxin